MHTPLVVVPQKLHASCVSIGSRGVLLIGKSGSGKSDVALRLISRGAMLVADDQTLLRVEGKYLIASVDTSIRGLLEIRGVGLVQYPVANNIPVNLVVKLSPREEMEHIPAPASFEYMGVTIPQITLHGFDAVTPDKIFAALYALGSGMLHTGFLPDKI